MSDSWLLKYPWIPVVAPVQGSVAERSLAKYREVLTQFNVQSAARYRATHSSTFCNIFVWDATSAMGCPIPHWYNLETGNVTPVGQEQEMSANLMHDWLCLHGFKRGWEECDQPHAIAAASAGWPVVAVYRNPAGIGHVAMVLPGDTEPHIVQAGRINFFDVPLHQGFGKLPVRYFSHR